MKLGVTKTSATVTNLSNPAQTVTLTGADQGSATNPIFTLGSAAIGTDKAKASFDDVIVKP